MMISIRVEEARDYSPIEHLTREAFWDLYHPGCSEHLIVHKIRDVPAFVGELSLVACEGDTVVGNIIYSRAKVVNARNQEFEVLCMGPIGVLPSCQKKGIGSQLMNASIQKAKALGFRAVIIYGSPAYYHRFGFVNAQKYGITTPTGDNFDAFMALELYDGALQGITGKFYADRVFEIDNQELEAFDKQFPYKEKHVTDTQLK
jgi:predicted N-acetyltransferase YhbS